MEGGDRSISSGLRVVWTWVQMPWLCAVIDSDCTITLFIHRRSPINGSRS